MRLHVTARAGREVGDDLMAEQVEIDPFALRRAPFGASQHLAVEPLCGVQVVDGKGDVEGRQLVHAHALPIPRRIG